MATVCGEQVHKCHLTNGLLLHVDAPVKRFILADNKNGCGAAQVRRSVREHLSERRVEEYAHLNIFLHACMHAYVHAYIGTAGCVLAQSKHMHTLYTYMHAYEHASIGTCVPTCE